MSNFDFAAERVRAFRWVLPSLMLVICPGFAEGFTTSAPSKVLKTNSASLAMCTSERSKLGHARTKLLSSRQQRPTPMLMKSSDDDSDFETWYQKEKNNGISRSGESSSETGPHAVGDVIEGEGKRWVVIRKARRDGIIFIYEAAEEDSSNNRVELQVLSLREMAGSWKGLDEFQQRSMLYRSLSHPAVVSHIASFEIDSPTDKTYYLVLNQEVTALGMQLLAAVEYLQSLRPPVQHLNINPHSILVDVSQLSSSSSSSSSACWLSGFAPSAEAQISMLSEGFLPSSLSLSSSSIDAAPLTADAFSVGAVLLRIVSGKSPADFLLRGKAAARSFRDEVYVSRGLGDAIEGLLAMGPGALNLNLGAASGFVTLSDARQALLTAQTTPDVPITLRPRPASLAGTGTAASSPGELATPGLESFKLSSTGTGPGPALRPAGTKIKVSVSENRLEVELPKQGLLSPSTLGVGGFTVAWNAIVGTWTVSAITAGAPLLFTAFSIPFWMAGAGLVSATAASAFVTTKLVINRGSFSLVADALGKQIAVVEGHTRDIQGSRVVTASVLQDGQPVRALELVELTQDGVTAHKVGSGLSDAEVLWLSAVVNEFLGKDLGSNLESV